LSFPDAARGIKHVQRIQLGVAVKVCARSDCGGGRSERGSDKRVGRMVFCGHRAKRQTRPPSDRPRDAAEASERSERQQGECDAGRKRGVATTAEGEGLPPDGHARADPPAPERQGGTTQPRPGAGGGTSGTHSCSLER